MNRAVRGLTATAAAVATFFFTFWVGGALLSLVGLPDWAIVALAPVAALLVARFTLRGEGGCLGHVAMGAILVGTVGFLGGFFGPLILTPEANQGPLLGLFITGPLGVGIGAVGGLLWWIRQHGTAARAAHVRRAHPSVDIGRDPTSAVLAVHARWIAFESDGATMRVLELCSEDVVWRPPGEPPISGKPAVRAWLAGRSNGHVERIDITNLRVDVSGDVAVKQADFATRVRSVPGEVRVTVRGTHAWTLRRAMSDGAWLVTDVAWSVGDGDGTSLP